MTNKQLEILIKKHTKAQEKATCLFFEIVDELAARGISDESDVVSCLNNTEPQSWEALVLQLINQEGVNNESNGDI